MPAIINSDDGVVSGSSGLKTSGANDGITVFQQNGTESMRIDSSGNITVKDRIQFGTDAQTHIQAGGTSDVDLIVAGDTNIRFETATNERMRIDSSGNVGIGTSSPSFKLDVTGGDGTTFDQVINGGRTANYAGSLLFKNSYWNSGAFGAAAIRGLDSGSSGGLLAFYTTTNGGGTTGVPTERARIDSSGNLLVGKTSTSSTATGVIAYGTGAADHGMISVARGSNATMIEFRTTASGNIVGQISQNGTNTTYSTSSDYRLKENIQPMTGALAKVQALKPCTYKWKADGSDGEGFIAHELAEVVPQCVTGEKDAVDADGNPVYQGIDTSFLVATLTAAIQELKAELDATKAEVAALKAAAK